MGRKGAVELPTEKQVMQMNESCRGSAALLNRNVGAGREANEETSLYAAMPQSSGVAGIGPEERRGVPPTADRARDRRGSQRPVSLRDAEICDQGRRLARPHAETNFLRYCDLVGVWIGLRPTQGKEQAAHPFSAG